MANQTNLNASRPTTIASPSTADQWRQEARPQRTNGANFSQVLNGLPANSRAKNNQQENRYAVGERRDRTTARTQNAGHFSGLGNTFLVAGATAAGAAIAGPAGALVAGRLASSANAGGAAGSEGSFSELRALQEEARLQNAEMFSLQTRVQDENRRFSSVSNLLKAQHDTNKAAINNIRA